MVTHIVSWGKHIISPLISSRPSIVSIESIQTSPAVREAPCVTESPAKHTSSVPIESSGSETLTSASTYSRAGAADASFVRHRKYFFKDGNVTFLVDGTLYCVHRYFFSRDSVYFSTRFAQLGIHDHEALPITISLGNIDRKDFDAFLSVLYPEEFDQHNLSYKEWRSVLHLSTQWEFASIRRMALNNIQPPTPHNQLLLARTYSVDQWVVPALSALCERRKPLSVDEARQMDIEDIVRVATVREDIRNHTVQVDAAEIPRCVEAAQAGKLARIDSVDVSSAVLTSRAVEQALSPVAEKRASNICDTDEVGGEALERPGAPEDVRVWRGSAQLVDDSWGAAVACEAEANYTATTGGEARNHTAEEEAAKAKACAEAKRHAEEAERRVAAAKAYAEAKKRAEEEEAKRRAAEEEVGRLRDQIEAGRRWKKR